MSAPPSLSSHVTAASGVPVVVATPQGNADVRVEVSGTYKRLVDAVEAQKTATAALLAATERIDTLAQKSEISRATFAQIKSLKDVLKKLTEVNSAGKKHSGTVQLDLIAQAAELAMQHVFDPKSKSKNKSSNGVPVRKGNGSTATASSGEKRISPENAKSAIPGLSDSSLGDSSRDKDRSARGSTSSTQNNKNSNAADENSTTITTTTTSDSTGISQVSDMMLNMASFPQLIVLLRKQVDTVEERTTEGSKNVLRILARLRDLIPDVTEKLLRTTHAGLLVAQLKRDPSTRISELSKYLIKVWKAVVLEEEKRKKAQAISSKNSSKNSSKSQVTSSKSKTGARESGSKRMNDKSAASSSRGAKTGKSSPTKSSGAGAVKRFVRGGGDASFEQDRALFRERQEKQEARNKARELEQRASGGERKGRVGQRSDRERIPNRTERERGRARKRSRSRSRSRSRDRSRRDRGGGGRSTNKKKKSRGSGSGGSDNEADFDAWMSKRRAQMRGSFERVQFEEERSAAIGHRDDRNAVL